MNKRIIRVSDAIPDMPASFDAAVERTLQTVCKKRQSAPLRAVETVTETEKKTKLTRWERAKKIMVASVAAVFAVLSLGIGAIVISRGLQNKQHEAVQPGNRVSETPSEQSSATDAITEHTYRIELCPSFDENTEPVSPEPAQENKISEKLRTALETTTEESLDLYVWFKDDGIEEAVQEKMQRTVPELYELYRKKLNNEPMTDAETDRVIEGARAVHTEVYQSMNRDRLNANLTDGQILYLGAYGPMCIVSVPTVMVEGLAESGDVVYLDLFENMTSTPSAEGDGVGLSAIRMSITELDVNPGTLQWTTELRLKKNGEAENPLKALTRVAHGEARCKFYNADGLLTEDAGAKLVELASKDNNYVATEDEADWIVRISSVAAMPQVYDSFPAALPPTGEITVEQTFFLVDAAADGEGLPVLLSRVHQSFTFDAEKLLNVKEPTHIDVPLSGKIILTVRTGTGYRNKRAALDGVTLDAEIHYTKTGVFVIVSIKDPGSLTEAQQDALLQAMNNPWNVNDCALACVDANGDQRMVYHLSRAFWGTTKLARFEALVLPVEYASAQTMEFRLCAFFVTGEAGGERNEDWCWDVKDGALPALMTERQSLGTFMLPLTEAAQTPEPQETPPPMPEPQKTLSVLYQGTLYLLTEQRYAGEPDESAIVGTIAAIDPYPTAREECHANFGEPGMPLALTCDGLLILYENEWRLLEPSQPHADISYYFLVDGVPVYPYEGFLWESKPELEADGIGVQLEDEEVRNRIPVTEYNVGMPLVVLTADGWKLDEIIVYDAAYERIVDVAGSKIPWKEGYGYVATDLLQTLSPGTYYVSAIVSYRAGNYSIGNEIAICLKIGGELLQPTPMLPQSATPAPKPASTLPPTPPTTLVPTPTPTEEPNPKHILMICYNGEVYGLHDEIRPDAPDADAASGTVNSVVPISEIPETDGQANFGSVGLRFYVMRDGLVVWYNNAWRLFVAIEFGHEG